LALRTGTHTRAGRSSASPRHAEAHLARAALEGIALQVMDVLKAMEGDAGIS
jgi:glycerol kinase